MLKVYQKVILIFKLELKYVLKFIAYTNKKCNGKSWQNFYNRLIKIDELANTVNKSKFLHFC